MQKTALNIVRFALVTAGARVIAYGDHSENLDNMKIALRGITLNIDKGVERYRTMSGTILDSATRDYVEQLKSNADKLFTADQVQARILALELESYNVARQKVSQTAAESVRDIADRQFHDEKFVVAIGPQFPIGVVGLVAGKVAHEIGKPTGVFQQGEETSTGSFRSIPGFSVIEALEACADLFEKFGGHEQAAGLTIRNDRFDAFLERFGAIVRERLQGVETVPELLIDAELHPGDLSLGLVQEIRDLSPFGEGNPEPVFQLSGLEIEQARTVGKDSKHWKLTLSHPALTQTFDAVGWSMVSAFPDLGPGNQLSIVCQIEENTWNGRSTLQLKLLDVKPGVS
jgi:single-stranded-DNA-specific exonuclease